MEVKLALWKEGKSSTRVGYILGRRDHALLVQRRGFCEQFWIHERSLMAVYA